MRSFSAVDGRVWNARLDNALTSNSAQPNGVGWEAVLFETAPPATQKVVYRPVGWLTQASLGELQRALQEAEAVRARWENPPLA
jgi:hypothetical protein